MKAVRMVSFKVINQNKDVKIVRINKDQIVKLASGLKKAGYRIVKDSILVSDTITIGYTNIIKMKKIA